MASFLRTQNSKLGEAPIRRQARRGEIRVFEFPFSGFRFRVHQFSNRGGKPSEFFRPTSTYPQHNKRPGAEYFVRPKMAHPTENTGVVGSISFKAFRFNSLTLGCLESLQSASLAVANTKPSSFHFRLRALSCLSPRVLNRESRVPAVDV